MKRTRHRSLQPDGWRKAADFHQRQRSQSAVGEHRAKHAALPEHAVVQRSPLESAIAERRADMLGFGHVDTAEVAFGEHDALGA